MLQPRQQVARFDPEFPGQGGCRLGDQRQAALGGGDDATVEFVERDRLDARRRRYRHRVDPAVVGQVQPQADVEFAALGKVVHAQPGVPTDALQCLAHRAGLRRRDHEPHVERVLAAVVVRNLRQRVDLFGDCLEARLRHCHGGERLGTTESRGVVERPEAAEHTRLQQVADQAQQAGLVHADLLGRQRKGPLDQREAALECVDQGARLR